MLENAHTKWGQQLKITGGIASLGNWNPENSCVILTTDDSIYPRWESEPILVDVAGFEFKLVITDESRKTVIWEDCENRKAIISAKSNTIIIQKFNEPETVIA